MKEFNDQDVQAAHDALRPHAQALVDRFGQAQAHEILIAVAEAVCPDRSEAPRFMFLPGGPLKAAN